MSSWLYRRPQRSLGPASRNFGAGLDLFAVPVALRPSLPQDCPMRRSLPIILVAFLVVGLAGPAAARAPWKRRIDKLVTGRTVSVMVRDGGAALYRWNPTASRTPASNEKLLLSMALLEKIPADRQIGTAASASNVTGGVVIGDLWLLGRGDPSITGGGRFGKDLTFSATKLAELARQVEDAGIRAITGSVVGSTGYFARDWSAPGWKPNFPKEEIPLPSALSYEGNVYRGRHIKNPEWRAARSLTRRLESLGVGVSGSPRAAAPIRGLTPVARVRSVPFEQMLRFMNRRSSNFFAEVFLKRLAVETYGAPGSLKAGARALRVWAARRGVDIDAYDGSGLSYRDRITAEGVAKLLTYAERQSWGTTLRSTLAGAGEGTLEDRLGGVRIRAKTGTLDYISTLSGWVWLRQTGSWAEFSIMSSGMLKSTASALEDQIVRELTRSASP